MGIILLILFYLTFAAWCASEIQRKNGPYWAVPIGLFWPIWFILGICLKVYDKMMEERKIPPPAGLDQLDLLIYDAIPDKWKHCASQRSRNKYLRRYKKEAIVSRIKNITIALVNSSTQMCFSREIDGILVPHEYFLNCISIITDIDKYDVFEIDKKTEFHLKDDSTPDTAQGKPVIKGTKQI
jgi:hypothetical protein